MVASQAWTLTAGWNWQEVRSRRSRRKKSRDEEEEEESDEEGDEDDEDVEASDSSNNRLLEIPSTPPRKPEAGPPGLEPLTPEDRLPGREVPREEQAPILYPMRPAPAADDASPRTGTEARRQEWECHRCTLINLASSSTCDACGASRPSGAAKASASTALQSPDRRQPASWSWRARDLYPWAVLDNPEWKVIVENTFLTVTHWRDRATRTSVSAPARLNGGKARLECHSDPGNARHDGHTAHRGYSPPADRPQRSNSGPAAAAGVGAASAAEAFARQRSNSGPAAAVSVHAKQVRIAPTSPGADSSAGSPLPHEPRVAKMAPGYVKAPTGRQPYNEGMMKVAPAEAAAGPPPGLAFHEANAAAGPPPGLAFHEVHIADEAAQGKKGCKKKVHIADEAEMHITTIKEAEDDLLGKAGKLSAHKEIYAEAEASISEKQPIVFPSGALQAEYTVAQLSVLQINLQDEEESIPELEEELQEDAAEQERHVHFKEPIDIESIASLEGDDSKVEQVVSPAEDNTPTNKTLKNRRKKQSIKARKARQKAEADSLEVAMQSVSASTEAADVGHAAVATTRTRAGTASAMFAHSPVRRQAWSTRRCVRAKPEVSVLSCEEDSAENAQVDFATGSDTETSDAKQLRAQRTAAQDVATARKELLSRTSALPTTSTAALVFMDRACGSASASLTCDAVDAVVSPSGHPDGAATAVLAALMRERAQASK
mmetsp:Transcript_117959/g.203847  ORF Transcript_117959/g.203847 Transcript_117959/m.203847 type:complete len:717 (-) Transcript_117959:280-2430(-)